MTFLPALHLTVTGIILPHLKLFCKSKMRFSTIQALNALFSPIIVLKSTACDDSSTLEKGVFMGTAVVRTGIERRRKGWYSLAFRIPDRRFGFDRRKPSGLIAKMRNSEVTVLTLLALINLFNLVDLIASINLFERGAIEANPILAQLFVIGTPVAAIFKAILVLTITAIMWRFRRHRCVLIGVVVALSVFAATMLYEAYLFVQIGGIGPAF